MGGGNDAGRRTPRRALDALHRGDHAYRILFDDNPQPMCLWDLGEARFLRVNEAALALYGYTRAEFLELDVRALRGADEPDRASEDRAAFLSGTTFFPGVRHRAKGGRIIDVEVTARALEVEGRLIALLVVEDVSERLEVERALRASEQRFRLFVAGVQDYAIFMLDADGHVTTWNAGAQRIKGYRPEDIIGRHFSAFYPPEDIAAGKPARQLTLATAAGRAEDEGWRVRKNGELFWANVVITALRNPDGSLRGFGKITRDLTERKRQEARLERTRRLRQAVTRALASSRTLEAASTVMLGDMGEVLGCVVGAIWLTDPSGGGLRIASRWSSLGAAHSAPGRVDPELAMMTTGAAVARLVWQKGTPLLVTDTGEDSGLAGAADAPAGGACPAVALPITDDGEVAGAITFLGGDVAGIDDGLLAELSALGRQIGHFVWRRQAEAALLESARSFRSLFDGNPRPIFVAQAASFRILAANEAAVVQYGYARDELLGMTIADLGWPEESAFLAEVATASAAEERRSFSGIRHRTRAGRPFDVEMVLGAVTFEDRHAWLAMVDDVSERIAQQRELEHRAFHDALTGLPNRALFNNRVEHTHGRLARCASRYAVLLVDLDNFKTINDAYGHGVGDQLLSEVSRRLAGELRVGETAARLGGDEFGIILEDLDSEDAGVTVSHRLLDTLREPYEVAGRSVTVRATIGIALSAPTTAAADDVVRNANVALHAAKSAGKNCARLFSEEMRAAVLGRLALEHELREGIRRGELVLRYQPAVDGRTGLVVGVEALVRWSHPVRGLLEPRAFVAMAEESALITEIDAWVLETACRQASSWNRGEVGSLAVAVNVSGRTVEAGDLLERVRGVLARTGLDPRSLELELTESAAMEKEAVAQSILGEIRALGVRIAIDDFGTGFSMLSRLQDFPLDTLKIDRSFIRRITGLDAESPIVAATVAMGRGLGLEVVAEGVETEHQRRYLVRQGCGRLQGYLISPPVEPGRISPMLGTARLPPVAAPRPAPGEMTLKPPNGRARAETTAPRRFRNRP